MKKINPKKEENKNATTVNRVLDSKSCMECSNRFYGIACSSCKEYSKWRD